MSINRVDKWYGDDGFAIDFVTHWQRIVLPKEEEMKNTVVIHGIKYKAVDSKRKQVTCKDCDIYNAEIPQSMRILPLCLEG